MSAPGSPNVWLEWRVPVTAGGTEVYRWAFQPLADEDSFKEGRVRSISPIQRHVSSEDGDPSIPTCTIEVDDSDGLVRGLIGSLTARQLLASEAAVILLSEAGRKAGTAANDLLRGRVRKVTPLPDRRARLELAGTLGALFSESNLKKTYPQQRLGDEHANLPEASRGLVYPLIIGSHTDVGAVDANGNAAEKGILPALDAGDVNLLEDGTEVEDAIAYLATPTGLGAVVGGTAGTTSILYHVTALSAWGETEAASVTVAAGPDLLNGTDTVALSWTAVTGATGYRVYRNRFRLATIPSGATVTYTDVGEITSGAGVPSYNSATTTVETGSGTAYPWARFVVAGKAVAITYVYASDLASNATPKRQRLTVADHLGTELLLPGETGYPHANTYVDLGGIRQTVVYLRGPRVQHHRERIVTVAWNGTGVEAVGDNTGARITQLFEAWKWLLNEEVLKDGGVGYLTGAYGPLEAYANSTAILDADAFDAAQTTSKAFLGDAVGYLASVAITEPTSLRVILRRFLVTSGAYDATNRWGQYYPFLVDDTASAPSLDHAYRDLTNIIRWVSDETMDDRVQTTVRYHYSWDADGKFFRVRDERIEYTPSTYGQDEEKTRAFRECYYSADTDTVDDAQDRYARRHLLPVRKMAFATDLGGLDDDLGAETALTHYDGSSSSAGDVDRRVLVIGQTVNVNGPEEVTLTVLDLGRIVAAA